MVAGMLLARTASNSNSQHCGALVPRAWTSAICSASARNLAMWQTTGAITGASPHAELARIEPLSNGPIALIADGRLCVEFTVDA